MTKPLPPVPPLPPLPTWPTQTRTTTTAEGGGNAEVCQEIYISAQEKDTINNHEEQHRIFVNVPPWKDKRLGVAVEFSDCYDGALIKAIDPNTCTFHDQITVGDRIVSSDGQAVTNIDDLIAWGSRSRQLGIIPAEVATSTKSKKPCVYEGCKIISIERGLCWRHRAYETKKPCAREGCKKKPSKGGYCYQHNSSNHGKKICGHDGCNRKVAGAGLCYRHGTQKMCREDGCPNKAVNKGVCWSHGAKEKKKKCSEEGCTNYSLKLGRCWRHGANKFAKVCSHEGCETLADRGGKCYRHGTPKICSEEGCETKATKSGKCHKHGTHKICSVEGCETKADKRGKCYKHGTHKICSQDGCKNQALRRGFCWRHGAKELSMGTVSDIDAFLRSRGCVDDGETSNLTASGEAEAETEVADSKLAIPSTPTNDHESGKTNEDEADVTSIMSSFTASMKSYVTVQYKSQLDSLNTSGYSRQFLLKEAVKDFPFLANVDWYGGKIDGPHSKSTQNADSNGSAETASTPAVGTSQVTEVTTGRTTETAKRAAASAAAYPAKVVPPQTRKRRKTSSPSPPKPQPVVEEVQSDSEESITSDEGGQLFEERLKVCLSFKDHNGHLRIPQFTEVEDDGMSAWAQTMRLKYKDFLDGKYDNSKKGRTVGYELEELEEIGFDFREEVADPPCNANNISSTEIGVDKRDGSSSILAGSRVWHHRVEQCRQFKSEKGHLNIPTTHRTLGDFSARMRRLYHQSSLRQLTAVEWEKIQFLGGLGFVFKQIPRPKRKKSQLAKALETQSLTKFEI